VQIDSPNKFKLIKLVLPCYNKKHSVPKLFVVTLLHKKTTRDSKMTNEINDHMVYCHG